MRRDCYEFRRPEPHGSLFSTEDPLCFGLKLVLANPQSVIQNQGSPITCPVAFSNSSFAS